MTFNVEPMADQEIFADKLEQLFESLAGITEGTLPAVSGTHEDGQHLVVIDIESDADDEVAALRAGLNLALRAFQSSEISVSQLEHVELAREHAGQPATA